MGYLDFITDLQDYMLAACYLPNSVGLFTFKDAPESAKKPFPIIWKVVFSFTLIPQIVIKLCLVILTFTGYLILWIPIVNFVWALLIEVFHLLSFLLGALLNLPVFKEYFAYCYDDWQSFVKPLNIPPQKPAPTFNQPQFNNTLNSYEAMSAFYNVFKLNEASFMMLREQHALSPMYKDIFEMRDSCVKNLMIAKMYCNPNFNKQLIDFTIESINVLTNTISIIDGKYYCLQDQINSIIGSYYLIDNSGLIFPKELKQAITKEFADKLNNIR